MATVTCQVPKDEEVSELLTGLLGRDVHAAWSPGSYQLPPEGRIACYRTDDDELAAVAVADPAFACRSGAALVLIPAGSADESVEADAIPSTLEENFHEVVNIMASLLNADGSAHVRLAEVLTLRDPRPDEVAAAVESPTKRRVFHATIDGYGRGTVTFMFV